MKFIKKPISSGQTITWVRVLTLIVVLLLSSDRLTVAQSDSVAEQEIRDAVLNRIEEDLDTMDLNEDGKVDVADLVNLVKSAGPTTPVASFDLVSSKVSEGDGTAVIQVNFTTHFFGTLGFMVSGTAEESIDYYALTGSVVVDGISVDIPIQIIDDLELEKQETIIITLDQADPQDLIIGVPQEYTLRIEENDAVWHGGFQVHNLSMGFEMEIAQDASSYQAVLKSDGYGTLPAGEWPVELEITQEAFSATIGPIQINEQDTLLGTAFDRTIVLEATPNSNDGHVFELDSAIVGNMSDSLEPQLDSRKYLRTTIHGTFSLIKGPTLVPIFEPDLIDLSEKKE